MIRNMGHSFPAGTCRQRLLYRRAQRLCRHDRHPHAAMRTRSENGSKRDRPLRRMRETSRGPRRDVESRSSLLLVCNGITPRMAKSGGTSRKATSRRCLDTVVIDHAAVCGQTNRDRRRGPVTPYGGQSCLVAGLAPFCDGSRTRGTRLFRPLLYH